MERDPSPTYYPIEVRLDREGRLFLWYSKYVHGPDPDRVLLDAHGDLLAFQTLDELSEYARRERLDVDPSTDHQLLDLDALEAWCTSPAAESIDCHTFINAWNMMDDVLLTLDRKKLLHDGQAAFDEGVYDKLFLGTNPRALMPDDAEDFEPSWTDGELEVIVMAFRRGSRNFRSILRK